MQGGLVDGGAGSYGVTTTGNGGEMPSVTGSPALPGGAALDQNGMAVTTAPPAGEMGPSPIERLLAGTTWTREDVELVVQIIIAVSIIGATVSGWS